MIVPKRNVMDDFEELLLVFPRDQATACTLKTPNKDDTDVIRAAIVGFSYNSPTESWAHEHYVFVEKRCNSEVLALCPPDYEARKNTMQFFSLCLGFLLGLFQASTITEREFQLAEALLPGFMALNAERIARGALGSPMAGGKRGKRGRSR